MKLIPPALAIVGRPNVGKSTLFNRLAGKSLAIIDDRPGVTRDRREARGRIGELELRLVDTAGYEDSDASLEARMRVQIEVALDEADICVFLINGREGVTVMDERFANVLRRLDKPVILAVNKCEGSKGESGALEAWKLGMEEPVPISAAHGEGISDLYARLTHVLKTARIRPEAEPEEEGSGCEKDIPMRLAVAGRPNVGKSTLINALIGKDRLITGPEAGLTRDAIAVEWEWGDQRVRLHDTAGLRKRGKTDGRLERMSAADTLRAIRFAEVVMLLVDAERPFEKQDLAIADRVVGEGRGLVTLITKWDLIRDKPAMLVRLREKFDRLLPQVKGAPLISVSSVSGHGLETIMPAVKALHQNWDAKVKTRDLNDWLMEMVQRHPPPAVDGRRIKLRYISQTKARPPTFVMMASRASYLPESYKRYLINGLRESFDLPGVPIRLIVKGQNNPYAKSGIGRRA